MQANIFLIDLILQVKRSEIEMMQLHIKMGNVDIFVKVLMYLM